MKETKKPAFSPREKRRGAGPLDEAVDHSGVLRPAPERARLRLHAAEVHDGRLEGRQLRVLENGAPKE